MMRALTIAIVASCLARSQSFEVASVKPAAPAAPGGRSGRHSLASTTSSDGAQVRYTNFTLTRLLAIEYGVQSYQISGPDWLENQRCDIVAKLPEGATKDQIPAMLKNPLAERFHLKAHTETKPEHAYVLVPAKGEPRLTESKEGADSAQLSFDGTGRMKLIGFTLSAFADTLSKFMDRPVRDMTGIQGTFDITLNVSMQELAGLRQILSAAGAPDSPESNSPSIFTAIQELGLKLESRNAPIQHIVVDSADKVPTGN